MLKRFLLMKFVPRSADAGLLALRFTCVLSLFLKHGLEKLFTFHAVRDSMQAHNMFLPAFGITLSAVCAMLGDGVCGGLLLLGLATRWAALGSFTSLMTAWIIIKHAPFFGKGPVPASGELLAVYSGVMVTLFIAGGGKFSLDALLDRKWGSLVGDRVY